MRPFLLGAAFAALLPTSAEACSKCGYAVCRYQYAPQYFTAAPYVAPSYDYIDHRFQVTYNVTFPPPAVSGATAYSYTGATLPLLDPALYLNSASRYLELAQATSQTGFQQLSQTSQVIFQGQQSIEELRARERLLEKAAALISARSPQDAIVTITRDEVPARSPAPLVRAGPLTPQSIVAAKCVRCHGPDRQSAGLRLDNLATLDARYETKIIAKVMEDNPADRMPPPDGEKLTLQEKLTLLRASGLCGKKD